MKRNLYYFICCFILSGVLGGCSMPVIDMNTPSDGRGNIILKISESGQPVSRAIVQNAEVRIAHIDIMIFKADGSFDYHERVTDPGDGEGTITLKKTREAFDDGAQYYVYLIANSDKTSDEFEFGEAEPAKDLDDLKAMWQQNNDIHIVGANENDDTEDYFLMDGVAHLKGDDDLSPLVVLDDGNPSSNTELEVPLRRAAAKFIITLKKGANVTFDDTDEESQSGYFIQNMPVSTSLLADGTHSTEIIRNPGKTTSEYFKYEYSTPSSTTVTGITVTGYAYAYNWENAGLGDDVRLVVNIPMYFDDPKTAEKENKHLPNNYYQVPISKEKKMERNTCYKVTVEVNAEGGSDPTTGIILDDVSYDVYDWIEVGVSVGAPEDFEPDYLSVNDELVQMYNIETDNTLRFASSSKVQVKVINYYFVDKDGDTQYGLDENGNRINETLFAWEQTGTTTENATIDKTMAGKGEDWWGIEYYNWDEWGTTSKNNWLREQGVPNTSSDLQAARTALNNGQSYSFERTVPVYDDVKVTWDENELNGTISLYSPMPINNTVRYIILEVTNEDGSTPKRITVEQYPLEYITPIEAWYSYRSDFYGTDPNNVTNYENKGTSRYVATSYSSGKWTHNTEASGFFRSKVFPQTAGNSSIYVYTWPVNRNEKYAKTGDTSNSNNRIYHVRITATSDDYTLGIPKLEKRTVAGTEMYVTDDDEANAYMVSPSFMIASQLGAVASSTLPSTHSNGIDMAASHCAQYVEVYYDGYDSSGNGTGEKHVLDDWRLPTSAELKIINRFQRTKNSAIDVVLRGSRYYSASEILNIQNQDLSKYPNIQSLPGGYDTTGQAIRCIRDAYEEE